MKNYPIKIILLYLTMGTQFLFRASAASETTPSATTSVAESPANSPEASTDNAAITITKGAKKAPDIETDQDPYAIPDLADKAANAKKKAAADAKAAADLKAANAWKPDPANPDLPENWRVIPGKMSTIDMGKNKGIPSMIGLDASGKPFRLEADNKTWTKLSSGGQNKSAKQNPLKIIRAIYGARRGFWDVTAKIRQSISNDELHIPVTDAFFGGDPCRGERKILQVWWEFNGRKQSTWAPQEGRFDIDRNTNKNEFLSQQWDDGSYFNWCPEVWRLPEDSNGTFYFSTSLKRDIFIGLRGDGGSTWWYCLGGDNGNAIFLRRDGNDYDRPIRGTFPRGTESFWVQVNKNRKRIFFGAGAIAGQNIFADIALPAENLKYFAFSNYKHGEPSLFWNIRVDGQDNTELFPGWNNGSEVDLTFKDIKIAGDGTIAAIDTKEGIWYQDNDKWIAIPEQAIEVSLGSSNEFWCFNRNKNVYRKKTPIVNNPWWQDLGAMKAISLAATGEGEVYAAGADQKIYRLNKHINSFEFGELCKPADMGMGNPFKIKAIDSSNIAFLDYSQKLWKLTPGGDPKNKDSWINITETLLVKDFCLGDDGSITIIDSKDRIVRRTLPKDEQKNFESSRGQKIYAGQIIGMNSGTRDGYRPVWTRAYCPWDPEGKNTPPDNHVQVCSSWPNDNDRKALAGNFFMLTKKGDPSNHQPIQFDDSVNIWSLYAAGTDPKKVGFLGKEWKWHADGKNLMVSLLAHPGTHNGSENFKLVSPIGKKGPIYEKDLVEIIHEKSNKNVWFDNPNGYPAELFTHKEGEDSWGFYHSPYGERARDCFQFKPMNKQSDVSNAPADGINLAPQAIFGKISGDFFKVASEQTKVDKDGLVNNHNDGIGVFKEVRNYTEFNLDASEMGTIKPQDARQGLNRDLITNLTIKGFSKESEIKDFGPSKMIQLDKLWSQGVAWITESLETPGKATISFLARPGDKGNIQVAFNNSLQPNAKWRIIIGGWENKTARILRGEQIMAEADAKTTHLATAAPGRFTPYWVSINNGFIMVGVGSPGENVFMSCLIPDPEQIDRYGFSSHDGNVDYTEVNKSGALQAWADNNYYKANEPDITLPPTQTKSIVWLKAQLRVPNEGTIAFNAQAKHSVTLVLQNAKKESYKVIIGANGNKELRIMKTEKKPALQIFTGQTGQGKIFSDKKTNFWVSIQGGRFIIGQGEPGENTFGVWEDQLPISNITNIGFETTDHQQTISDFKFSPPVTIGTEQEKSTYDKIVDRFPYKGSVLLIRYFEFQFAQDGQHISAKDMVTGQNFHIFPTPQQGARYILKLDIQADGTPSVTQLEGPHESPAKIELNRQAALADIDAAKFKDQAEGVLKAGKSLGEGWSGGSGVGSIIASAGSLLFAGVGAGVHAAGSQAAADAAKKRLQAQLGYRADDSPVFTEAVNRASGLKPGDVPDAAVENKKIVTDLLNQARFLSFNKDGDYIKLLALYLDALRRVSHAYVVEDTATKQSLYDALDEFQDAYKLHPDLYSKVMSLFVKAFSNNYLTNSSNKNETKRKDRWYAAILDICSNVFEESFKDNNAEIEVAELRGEYLWLPRQFVDGKGSITFEAKGQNDVFVCFAQQDYKVKGPRNNIYEFDFGAWENTTIEARIRSLGKPATKISVVDTPKYEALMLNPRRFQSYWISFDNGLIQIGSGNVIGKNSFMKWQDPFPWQKTIYIGFGSWDVPITIRNIKLTNVKSVSGTVDLDEAVDNDNDNPKEQPAEETPQDRADAESKALADDEGIDEDQPAEEQTTEDE